MTIIIILNQMSPTREFKSLEWHLCEKNFKSNKRYDVNFVN